jgi:hypothetical protein
LTYASLAIPIPSDSSAVNKLSLIGTIIQKVIKFVLEDYLLKTCVASQLQGETNASNIIRIHLVSMAMECLGNCAMLMGQRCKPLLNFVLYPLMALVLDRHVVIKQASVSTLHRLALYLSYGNFRDMIVSNLEFLVDESCSALRGPSGSFASQSQLLQVTYSVLELVLDTIGYEAFYDVNASSMRAQSALALSPVILLKDMILNTLDNVDNYAAMGLMSHKQVNLCFTN